MKNLFILLFIVSLSLLFSHNARASFQSDVTNCLKIHNTDDRLDCYDTVVKYYKLNPTTSRENNTADSLNSPIVKAVPSSPVVLNTPIVPISHTSLLTPATKPNEITNEASVTDDFGRVEKEADIESIKSRLVGKFTSWEKGIILKLENGQKWKVVSASNGYKKMLNPMITISRGLFGSFNARVDGLNAGAKVKRVK